jgi:hypothetical protein
MGTEPSHMTYKSRVSYSFSGMNCVRKSGTAFILVNAFLKITHFYVTCAAFNNTFPAVLMKKLSSERLCCGLLGRVWKCSWLILKQHLSREKSRRPKNRWSSGRELSRVPMKFEPGVRAGPNRDVSLPSTWWNWQLLKLNFCFSLQLLILLHAWTVSNGHDGCL